MEDFRTSAKEICSQVGYRPQDGKLIFKGDVGHAILVTIETPARQVVMRVYAPANYVKVTVRVGGSMWYMLGNHDSAWRDAVTDAFGKAEQEGGVLSFTTEVIDDNHPLWDNAIRSDAYCAGAYGYKSSEAFRAI